MYSHIFLGASSKGPQQDNAQQRTSTNATAAPRQQEIQHHVRLVAASGKEQAVLLCIRRDGLWLYTQGGKEIQQLPYQHIVKWLPSGLRSKDPGPADCLDVQVETTAGKKDLRMRCADEGTVQTVISDIRTTVQAVMSELDSSSKAVAAAAGPNKQAAAAAQRESVQLQQLAADALQSAQQQQQVQQTQPAGQALPALQDPPLQHQPNTELAQPAGQQQHEQTAAVLTAAQQQLQNLLQQQLEGSNRPQSPQQQQQQHSPALSPHKKQQQQQPVDSPAAAAAAGGAFGRGAAAVRASAETPKVPLAGAGKGDTTVVQGSSSSGGGGTGVSKRSGQQDSARQQIAAAGVSGLSAGSSPLRQPVAGTATRAGVAGVGGVGSPSRAYLNTGQLSSSLSPVQAALLSSKETQLDVQAAAALAAAAGGGGGGGLGSSSGRPGLLAVDLARLGVGAGAAGGAAGSWQQVGAAAAAGGSEAAAQIRFLEGLVKRLSEELAVRMGGSGGASSLSPGAATVHAGSHSAAAGGSDVPLPPWMKDSRYLNPLLEAYDTRLAAAQAEVAARAQAARDIQAQVTALVAENDSLHDQLARATARAASAAAADRVAAAAAAAGAGGDDSGRFQERLELLETENDLLLAQQGELEEEIVRLGQLLHEREGQLGQLQAAAAAATAAAGSLRSQLADAQRSTAGSSELRAKVQELTSQLAAESARAAAAVAAADAAAAAQAASQRELGAAQATGKSVHTLQAELSRARTSAEVSAAEAASLRVEGDSLRKALRAMEGRLAEYQAKDTEVYLRIKAAMELAEEARLERDAATSTTAALKQQLEATQARLADATRQLLGGCAADGGLGAAEVRARLAAAEREAARSNKALSQAEAKVAELQASSAKLARDKASLAAELTTLRDELGCCCCAVGAAGGNRGSRSPVLAASASSPMGTPGRLRAEMLSERLQDAERQRDDVVQRLDSYKRAAARVEKDWELQRNNLHADVQRLTRKVTAAEAAAASAAAAAAESRAAAAAAEAELSTLRGAAAREVSDLRAQLAQSRADRDAEVSGLASKLEAALAACDRAVGDAEGMVGAKDGLLAEWKKEAQLVSSKLESVLQQQAAERDQVQQQVEALSQQLAHTQEQVALLEQELEATRAACAEGDLLLQEGEARLTAASASAAAAQEAALQEVSSLQGQLERAQLERVKAERQRDNLAARLERLLQQQQQSHQGGVAGAYGGQQCMAETGGGGLSRVTSPVAGSRLSAGLTIDAAAAAETAAASEAKELLRAGSGWTNSSGSGGSGQSSPSKAASAAVAAATAAAASLVADGS